MTIFSIILGFALSPLWANPASAPDAQKKSIITHIEAGLAAREDFLKAKEDELNLRKEILPLIGDGDYHLERLEEWKTADNERKKQESLMQENLDQALRETASAYGFLPEGNGVIAKGPLFFVPTMTAFFSAGPWLLTCGGPRTTSRAAYP